MKKIVLPLFALAISFSAVVPAQSQAEVANSTIVRRSSGVYRYESMSDPSQVRGKEHWQLLVHPDGSRDMLAWHDLAARNAQFTVVQRVADDFRPLESFANYWDGAIYRGSVHLVVNGGKIEMHTSGPAGSLVEQTEVPAVFSVTSHPVAVAGWHTANYDEKRGGVQTLTIYSSKTGGDLSRPVKGGLTHVQVERVGGETIDVPAGRFQATRYRFIAENDFWVSGPNRFIVSDIWVSGPDRLVVKSTIPTRDQQYVLLSADGQLTEH